MLIILGTGTLVNTGSRTFCHAISGLKLDLNKNALMHNRKLWQVALAKLMPIWEEIMMILEINFDLLACFLNKIYQDHQPNL